MGFNLRREVRDKLPPGLLTARERLLVLEIADHANDDTRLGFPGVGKLAERADMPVDKVGAALNAIGRKWAELRVPLGKGKDGRPYYSHPTKRTTYRLPSSDALDALRDKATQKGGPSDGKATRNGPPKATQSGGPKPTQNRGPKAPQIGGPFSSVFSSMNSSSLSSQPEPANDDLFAPVVAEPNPEREQIDQIDNTPTHHKVLATIGINPDDADTLAYAADHHLPGGPKGGGWWRNVQRAGDLQSVVDDLLIRLNPTTPEPEDQPEPCPLHRGNPNWKKCSSCRADWYAGDDSYAGHEHLRPDGWHDAYPTRVH